MPGTENPNLPTYGLSEAAVEERQPEVPDASFAGGGNEAASNSPGIGINTGDYDPKPSDWPREERAPQTFGHIGLAPLLAGDIRVDNDMPDEAAFFIQAAGPALPGELIPGTNAVNNTGVTIPSGAWLWAPGSSINSIIALFGNGTYGGGLWVPKRLINGVQNLYQDSAGTIPVVADGDPVGLIIDSSGNGNHLIQTVAGSRPTYKTDGTYEWVIGDGIDDYLLTQDIDFTNTPEATLFVAVQDADPAATKIIAIHGYTGTTPGQIRILTASDGRISLRSRGASSEASIAGPAGQELDIAVYGGRRNISTPTVNLWKDGANFISSGFAQGGGNGTNAPFYLFTDLNLSNYFNGNIYGSMLINRYLDDEQMAKVSEYFAGLHP